MKKLLIKLGRKIKNATSPFTGPVVILIKKATSKIGGKIKKIKFPFIKVATVIAIGLMIALLFIVLSPNKKSTTTKSIPAPTPKPSASDIADKTLQDANWDPSQYVLNNTDVSKDKAEVGGVNSFALKGAKTIEDVVIFLKSNGDRANALLNQVIKDTSSSKEDVLDPSNWVAVQPVVPFNYPGNSAFKEGKVVASGMLKGNPGDIFFIYVSPTSGKVMVVRGACANPQTVVPKPTTPASPTPTPTPTPTPKPTPTLVPLPTQNPNYRIITNPAPTPTPTPVRHSHGGGSSSSYLQPKTPDTSGYEAPGSDGTNGSGTDTRSPRPTVTPAPSATPTPVQTSHNGGGSSRVTDSSSSKPNSTSGTTVPGVSTDTTPRSVPAPAQSNNSGADTGAPANPF
jgi:hypothetical protein